MSIINFLHIHTDSKFLHDTLKYIDDRVHNTIIYIGEETPDVLLKLKTFNIPFSILSPNQSVAQILNDLEKYDRVILNEFCAIKREIVRKANSSNKFYLRLFGYELYGHNLYKYLHKSTINSAFYISFQKHTLINYLKRKIKRFLKIDLIKDKSSINNDLKKLSGIILVSQEEYDELKTDFNLPSFIQLPLSNSEKNINVKEKNSTIIFGNSKHYWNNHLEVLKKIRGSKANLMLFFSYGSDNLYTQKIEELVAKEPTYTIQKSFLSFSEFENRYSTSAAIVINSYRQHALGNIITAIFSGCKIYLNPKSATYKWLINNHFYISTISNFKTDINTSNIYLSKQQIEHNIACYLQITKSYTTQNFICTLIQS